MRYVGLGRNNLRSHFVFRLCLAPEWLRARFLPVVFLANGEELTGKTFTTPLNTTNPNTYVKFISLRTSPSTKRILKVLPVIFIGKTTVLTVFPFSIAFLANCSALTCPAPSRCRILHGQAHCQDYCYRGRCPPGHTCVSTSAVCLRGPCPAKVVRCRKLKSGENCTQTSQSNLLVKFISMAHSFKTHLTSFGVQIRFGPDSRESGPNPCPRLT